MVVNLYLISIKFFKIINDSIGHPQSQGALEKFNDTIITKIKYFKIENQKKFNIIDVLNYTVNVYNNTTHSIIKIEPIKAIKMKNKKDLNKVVNNMIKSQININKNNISIEKGSKGLLCSFFILKG